MSLTISCPVCGRDDLLNGRRDGASVVVTCGACEHVWVRTPGATCDRCGGSELLPVAQALVDKSRGTQLSVLGVNHRLLCRSCDVDAIARLEARGRGRLVLPEELPTSSGDDPPRL